jgi:kynurenine 3-monooxygenase
MGNITVVGSGLCGSLLALRLAQRGHVVNVFEKRPDPSLTNAYGGRSINLALSDRGLAALEMVGLSEKAREIAIPMLGRAIHVQSELIPTFVNYSGREGEYINSISRRDLNILLINELKSHPNVTLTFDADCKHLDEQSKIVTFGNSNQSKTHSYDILIATDGANSAVRERFMQSSAKIRFDFSQSYLDTGYKELEIPAGADGSHQLSVSHLHIWPRPGFMMIALPNMDGSFTVTLFLPFEGQESFSKLNDETQVNAFFDKYFYTAKQLMPDLIEDFNTNPSSSLATIKSYPWLLNDSVLLMGDAAHAIVPFYGQGMNAAFEDVIVLDRLCDLYGDDWTTILNTYQKERKIDTDAIADLARDNFYEMRDATADPVFLRKRKIELMLEQTYEDYFSKYSMVTFREDMPYNQAMALGREQDEILMEIAAQFIDISTIDLNYVKNRITNHSSAKPIKI